MKKVALLFALSISALINADTLLHVGNLLDTNNGEISKAVTIRIKGNKILEVTKGYATPKKNDEIVNLKQSYVLPGFMDMHVHLAQEYVPKAERRSKIEPEYRALFAANAASKTLMAGFTSVRNLGDGGMETISLRDAIKEGLVIGPRIFTSGKTIATTGGHGDPTNGMPKDNYSPPSPEEGVIDSPEDAKKAVRQRYKDGADGIKITATGGVLSVAKSGENPQFTDEELNSIVATANDYGLWTAAHAHGKEGMKRAVIAGINSIEHGTYMDQEVMDLMKSKGTYYVPTIMAGDWVAEKAKIPNFFPALVKPKAEKIGPQIQSTFAKAYKAGVKIAFGTDSGVSAHGDNWQEFILMTNAGMTNQDALKSATIETAKLLRIEDKLGQIKPGMLADIIAVQQNPVEDISTVENVIFVMKDGVIFKDNT
ncbi:amidohydrolase family protein [Gammaproteobacteria bacterium]|jgi:imidazolonepropionase-like amidohydrolase|nr:amidohydrolase family protein [Gammaproteobacteria bacterium]|tara:strand:- start:2650 stop:3927 length:1278 start_codon:yes stop_codon:yes gene_type:complete